jgi:hypothetical protein
MLIQYPPIVPDDRRSHTVRYGSSVRGRGGSTAAGVILRATFVVVIAGLVFPALGAEATVARSHDGADVLARREAARVSLAPSLASADERQRSTVRAKWSKMVADPPDVVALTGMLLAGAISLATLRCARSRPGLGSSSRSPPLPQPV